MDDGNGSLPSVKEAVNQEMSFSTFSNMRLQETNLSAQNTTAFDSVAQKAAKRNVVAKSGRLSAHATNKANFQGIEEIVHSETSAMVKNEMDRGSGKWSSDMQDESITLTHSCKGHFEDAIKSTAFAD